MTATDELTGILTREFVLEAFERARLEAGVARSNLALISLDIDEFAAINRQFGHVTGDEVLRAVSAALKNNFHGTAIWWGGMPGMSSSDFAARRAFRNSLRRGGRSAQGDRRQPAAAQNRRPAGAPGGARLGRGSRIPGGWQQLLTDLFRKADEALYRAKGLGRNRICLPASAQMVTKTSHFTQVRAREAVRAGQEDRQKRGLAAARRPGRPAEQVRRGMRILFFA